MNIISRFVTKFRTYRYNVAAQKLKQQIPELAAENGWDPEEEWVRNFANRLPELRHGNNIATLVRVVEMRLNADTFVNLRNTEAVEVRARYDRNYDPNPLSVAKRKLGTSDLLDGIVLITIGSHITTLHDNDGPKVQFIACGRKMYYQSTFRADNASRLIKELIGFDISASEIAQPDLSMYNTIAFESTLDGWQMHIAEVASPG